MRDKIGIETAEAALRRLATLPAPEGLEERLELRLRVAMREPAKTAPRWRVWSLAAPVWVRAAAVMALVLAVAGGCWEIALHLNKQQEAHQQTAPLTAPAPTAGGGFATGNAIRTPRTLNGPTIPQAKVQQVEPTAVPTVKTKDAKTRNRKARAARAAAVQ